MAQVSIFFLHLGRSFLPLVLDLKKKKKNELQMAVHMHKK